jgi:hypothetical protein
MTEPKITEPFEQGTIERTFFQRRIIDELGVTDQQNRIRLKFDDMETGTVREVEYPIFSEDQQGNIRIRPLPLRRELIQYDSQKATPTVRNIENTAGKYSMLPGCNIRRNTKTKTETNRNASNNSRKGPKHSRL